MEPLRHWIGGGWRDSVSSERVGVHDPTSGDLTAMAPAGCQDDVDAAVSAARSAAAAWRTVDQVSRAELLRATGRAVADAAPELARAESAEMGRPVRIAEADIRAAALAFERYADLASHLVDDDAAISRVTRRPYGVAALIVPWNYPVVIAVEALAPLLAAGNVVVLKPSEKSPLSATVLARLTSHLPPGVVSVVLGDARAGRPLVEHAAVDLIHFTGSVDTGRRVAEAAARRLVPAFLELGGKDALVVDEGVDPERAAAVAADGGFANSGQVCTSIERVFVHRAVAGPFLDAVVRRAAALVVGHPDDPATDLGPMVDTGQRALAHAQVEAAVAAGARVVVGGRVPEGPGAFYPPTVLTDVPEHVDLMTRETFGPVLPVVVVDSFAEGLRRGDAGDYGLSATVLTPDLHHARLAADLDVAIVTVNEGGSWPSGAVYEPARSSGVGAVGDGLPLLHAFTRPTTVVVGSPPVAA